MRTLIICILLCTPALAQKPEPAELTGARKAHETEVAKAKAAYDDAVKELNRKYANKLKELQEERTKKGDLDGALAVRKEGERVGKVPANVVTNIDGIWNAVFVPAKATRVYIISGDKCQMTADNEKFQGTITREGDRFKVDFSNNRLELWHFAPSGRMFIETYRPDDLHNPVTMGVGVRK